MPAAPTHAAHVRQTAILATLRRSRMFADRGPDELAAFRRAFVAVDLPRDLDRTVITTFGRDTATASTLFRRASAPGKLGRQMQTWVRFADGWKVAAAHVSIVDE